MPKLIILGSSNAIPNEQHENTHMLLVGNQRSVMIDCVGTPLLQLKRLGIDHRTISDMVLTHFHPDHVSGLGLFLMNTWLLGRKEPLNIYGLAHTLERAEKMMGYFDWETWPRFYGVNFNILPDVELTPVLESDEYRILASPVRHIIPTIGLRVEFAVSGKVLAYSCDTEPCPQVEHLAAGADVLIHEATGKGFGHTAAVDAGALAERCEVGALYLIHYTTQGREAASLVREAQTTFQGPVALAEDFLELEF